MSDFQDTIGYDIPFEATTDAMAVVEVSNGRWQIQAVNSQFETAFDCDESAVRGECLRDTLDLEVDQKFRSRVRAGAAAETRVDVEPVDEALLRVRPFDGGTSHSLVVIAEPPAVGESADERDGLVRMPMGELAELARADDAAAACEAAAELLCEQGGFDAFVADLRGEDPHLKNVDEPILPESADRSEPFVGYDVQDHRNDTRWGLVVQYPVGDRGVIQVASRTEESADPRIPRSVERFGEYFGAVLDRVDRERTLATERDELAIFNRVLRHEVVNGLSLIRARLDLIEADVSEENREHYDTLRARVENMIDRAEAVREMGKDEPSIETEGYALGPVVREQVDSASEMHPDATFTVVGSIPDLTVAVDDLVHFCLQNVLRNSVQHADIDSPEVRVDVHRTDGHASIRLADNGPGLPDHLTESVFGEDVTSREGEVHGEGLFLTRRIIEDLYGGAIRAGESERGGAEFVIELPLANE